MGVAYTGDRGQPVVASEGNTPTFGADLTAIAAFAAKGSFRRFTTLVSLLATDGVAAGDLAVADDAPGRVHEWDGTDWAGLRFVPDATYDALLDLLAGEPVSWTPTLTNLAEGTGGSAERSGTYRIAGGMCFYSGLIVFGTSGRSLSNNPTHDLPVTPDADWAAQDRMLETGLFRDASVSVTDLLSTVPMSNAWDAAGSVVRMGKLYTGSVGITNDFATHSKSSTGYPSLAAGDYITFEGCYPVAS